VRLNDFCIIEKATLVDLPKCAAEVMTIPALTYGGVSCLSTRCISRVHYLFSDDEADTLIEEAQAHLDSGDPGSSDGEGSCTGPLGNQKSQPVQGENHIYIVPLGCDMQDHT
jgi:hypothetical protein